MMHWLGSLLSTDLSPLVESAFRSLLLACVAGAGLKVLRVRHVVAQKAVWMLVLGCAFAMPVLAPLALRVPLPHVKALPLPWKGKAPAAAAIRPAASAFSTIRFGDEAIPQGTGLPLAATVSPAATPAPESRVVRGTPANVAIPAPPAPVFLTRVQVLFLMYLGTCATLLFRLAYGGAMAARLWRDARREAIPDAAFARLSIRSSARIASPLTIGSGILLPADFGAWDGDKLRIVLAHEASHVRQRDFYLQLAAGLYAAIFWFSPLGWWLKRRLSDLSEAISDRAGLSEAADPISYAQLLMEFAALPHSAQMGVAMARQGRLTQRIERLLNESSFRDAFTATRVRNAVALLLVPMGLLASTALVRVQAAAQVPQTPAPAVVPEQVPPPPAGVPDAAKAPQQTPSLPTSPANAPVVAPSAATPADQAAPRIVTIPPIPAIHIHTEIPPIDVNVPAMQAMKIEIPQLPPQALLLQLDNGAGNSANVHANNNYGAYTHERDGEFYGLFERHGGSPRFTGTWTNGHSDAIAKAEALARGDFILYTDRSGKSYYIDDPQTVAQMEELYAAVANTDRQRAALERASAALARVQAESAARQKRAPVSKADLDKNLTELNAAIAKLQAEKGSTIAPDQLADLQQKLSEMQSKLIEFEVNEKVSSLHLEELNAHLASELAKADAEQAVGAAQASELARNAEQKLKSAIDAALKNGTAKPVQ